MKLLIVGCGQCGGRIADEFARLNRVAHAQRGLSIVTNTLAVNTDIADLSGLYYIKSDFKHRILIGGKKTGGHGVGKMNEVGADIAREDGDKVIETIRATDKLAETDAFLVAGSFKYEEVTEERSVYNVGTCLKSAYLAADAIFLVDNQRYITKNLSIRNNLAKINYLIVKPFYNLLCAGEETDCKYIGSKVLDAGDIIQTLAGWSVIGYGKEQIQRFSFPFGRNRDFRDKGSETQRGIQSMDEALGELSLKCNPTDARKGLYLITAPPDAMSMDIIKELSSSLKSMATEAIIRSGDYPRGKGALEATVILSELVNSKKVMNYFTKAISYISNARRRQGGIDFQHRGLEEAFKDIPSLF
jgi:cell division GTPase FtsZ